MRRVHTIGVFLLIGLLSCGEDSLTTTLRLGHGLDHRQPVHKAMVFMAKRVAELSEGRMEIIVYPNQQLGTERQCLELLQIGSLAMTKVSAAVLENFAPKTKVLGLPYLFRTREHAYAVQDGEIGLELLRSCERYRFRGLSFLDAGQRSFYTVDRPVHQPADLKGLKIRVQQSATAIKLVKQLGGSPTPIAWGEIYTSLQQGLIDGAENNPPSFYNSGHYEIAKFYSLNEHTAVPDVLLISTEVFDGLTAQEQSWLQAAVSEATAFQRELWQTAEKEAIEAVEAAGVQVIRPNKTNFMEQSADILKDYRDEPEVASLIQRIQAVAE